MFRRKPTATPLPIALRNLNGIVDVRAWVDPLSADVTTEQHVGYRCMLGEELHLRVESTLPEEFTYTRVPRRDTRSADGRGWRHLGQTSVRPRWANVDAQVGGGADAAEPADAADALDVDAPELEVRVIVSGAAPFEKLSVGSRKFRLV